MLIDGNFVGKSLHLSLIFRIFVLKIRDDDESDVQERVGRGCGSEHEHVSPLAWREQGQACASGCEAPPAAAPPESRDVDLPGIRD